MTDYRKTITICDWLKERHPDAFEKYPAVERIYKDHDLYSGKRDFVSVYEPDCGWLVQIQGAYIIAKTKQLKRKTEEVIRKHGGYYYN